MVYTQPFVVVERGHGRKKKQTKNGRVAGKKCEMPFFFHGEGSRMEGKQQIL